ncbi:MAG: hypothetical protein AAF984_02735 [Verrucomicrobiota bacterium]
MKNYLHCLTAVGVTLVLLSHSLMAQETVLTPEQKTELKARFAQGVKYVEAARYVDALAIFKENLRQDPKAMGSLFMAGVVYNELRQFDEATAYFERFLQLEPKHAAGLIGAIKSNQAVGHENEVKKYIGRLKTLKNTGKDQRLTLMESFEREVIPLSDGSFISAQEYFEFKMSESRPFWIFLLMQDRKMSSRRLELRPAPAEEAKLIRMQNPEVQGVYILTESKYKDGAITGVKIHKMFMFMPEYEEVRNHAKQLLESME